MEKLKFINCSIINPNVNIDIIKNAIITVNISNGTSIIKDIGITDSMSSCGDCKVVDLQGGYVLPGLINAHCHLFGSGKPMKSFSNQFRKDLIVKALNNPMIKVILQRIMKNNVIAELNSGVTAIRTLGDFHNLDLKIRNDISNRKMTGPVMISSGQGITVTKGHAYEYALCFNSLKGARECIRRSIKNGANVIKIFSTSGVLDMLEVEEIGQTKMNVDEMRVICDEAHNAGLMVASHVVCKKGIKEALLAGVDTIEHGAEIDDEIVELFKKNPASLRGYSALIPTLYPAAVLSKLGTEYTKISGEQREKAKVVLDRIINGIKRAVREGIKVGLGNDAGAPLVTHYDLWREIECRVKLADLNPAEVLYQATKANAEILGIDTYTGSVEVGKRADFIVLEGDPHKDVRYLSKPQMVIIDGYVISNPKLKRYKDIDDILNGIVWH